MWPPGSIKSTVSVKSRRRISGIHATGRNLALQRDYYLIERGDMTVMAICTPMTPTAHLYAPSAGANGMGKG